MKKPYLSSLRGLLRKTDQAFHRGAQNVVHRILYVGIRQPHGGRAEQRAGDQARGPRAFAPADQLHTTVDGQRNQEQRVAPQGQLRQRPVCRSQPATEQPEQQPTEQDADIDGHVALAERDFEADLRCADEAQQLALPDRHARRQRPYRLQLRNTIGRLRPEQEEGALRQLVTCRAVDGVDQPASPGARNAVGRRSQVQQRRGQERQRDEDRHDRVEHGQPVPRQHGNQPIDGRGDLRGTPFRGQCHDDASFGLSSGHELASLLRCRWHMANPKSEIRNPKSEITPSPCPSQPCRSGS